MPLIVKRLRNPAARVARQRVNKVFMTRSLLVADSRAIGSQPQPVRGTSARSPPHHSREPLFKKACWWTIARAARVPPLPAAGTSQNS